MSETREVSQSHIPAWLMEGMTVQETPMPQDAPEWLQKTVKEELANQNDETRTQGEKAFDTYLASKNRQEALDSLKDVKTATEALHFAISRAGEATANREVEKARFYNTHVGIIDLHMRSLGIIRPRVETSSEIPQ